MSLSILPYKKASRSSKLLMKELECNLCKNKFHNGYVINWGSTNKLSEYQPLIINHPLFVRIAVNKLYTLEKLENSGVSVPEWTKKRDVAEEWLNDDKPIICRTLLTSNSGKGAYYVEKVEDIPEGTKIFTKYFPRKNEYRIHVFNGQVILSQEKRKRKGTTPNYKIRNHGDWVFCIKDVHPPLPVITNSIKAVKALGLTFGAVDIGWNDTKQKAAVFEINTAPGISPSTAKIYAEAIRQYVGV